MSKVSVVGAGFYGSTTAQRLAEYDIFDTVALVDIIEGKPQGIALDINQSRPVEGFETKLVGSNDYDVTEGSDIVVITAGLPRKPGMSRMDLLEHQRQDRPGTSPRRLVAVSPDAVIVVVSNPLDEMTALASIASGLPEVPGDGPGRHARHGPVHQLRGRGAGRSR